MYRIVCASVALGLLCLAPMIGSGAPLTRPTVSSMDSAIILAQQPGPGWWEQENRYDDARQRYWDLRRPDDRRYNQLQAQINQLQRERAQIDAQLNAAIQEQHRILGYR